MVKLHQRAHPKTLESMALASLVVTREFLYSSFSCVSFLTIFREGNGGRALVNGAPFTGGLTIAKCVTACKSAGYSLAGAEYGGECCRFLDILVDSDY